MRVLSVETTPIAELPYRAARSGGGVASHQLPIVRAKVDKLPSTIDALVVTSDLEGIADDNGASVLLGVALATLLDDLGRREVLPPSKRVGVLLAGDFFSAPDADVRGADGDVRPVWQSFIARFRWAAGVAGNHDTFGDRPSDEQALRASGAHILDGDVFEREGLRIGGIGGSVGDPRKPRRKSPREFARFVRKLAPTTLDVLMLHGGPDVPADSLGGSADVRLALDRLAGLLVICGHAHWPTPLATIRGGAQVLNVDSRVVVLSA